MSARIKDIAEIVGVSRGTVDRAIHNRPGVDEAIRQKILHVAQELDYHPNIFARGLKLKKSYLIGIVMPEIVTSFWAEVVQGIEDTADERDYALLLCTTSGRKSPRKHLSVLSEKQVDGIITTSLMSPDTVTVLQELISDDVPMVCINNYNVDLQIPYVTADHENGGYMATRHLISLGHTRIAYAGIGTYEPTGLARYRGYIRAVEEAGLPVDEGIICRDVVGSSDYAELMQVLTQPDAPTAVFAGGDFIAMGVIRQLWERGLSVPKDVSVVGFDDIYLASQFVPALTTIRQPKADLGIMACKMLLQQMKGSPVRNTVLDVDLVVRESTEVAPARR